MLCVFHVSSNMAVTFFGYFIAVIATASCQFRFDYTFSLKAGGWLKLHEMPLTFLDAFRRCNAEGAVLASPLNVHLKNAMNQLHKKINGDCPVFTGIHSSIVKGAFTSIEGVPISNIPTSWAPNEPNNFNNTEDCIVMLKDGTMADVSCFDTFPFVCYKKKTKNLSINDCGTIDNEYTIDHRTGNCYKFHKFGRSWRNAYMTCVAEGGYLAVINNITEVEVIKDVFAKVPGSSTFVNNDHVAFIGYYDWGEYRKFYTVHGDTLEQTGYYKFGAGNPDNGRNVDGPYACGAIARDGLLFDVWCNNDICAFICEKAPASLLGDEL